MTDDDNIMNAINAGIKLAGVEPRIKILDLDGIRIPVALVEEGNLLKVAVLDEALAEADRRGDGPLHRTGNHLLTEVDSFVTYVKRYATTDALVYANTDSLGFVAVLDDHPPGDDATDTAWRTHRAQYTCPRSPEWQAWTLLDGRPQPQEAFADFIESRLEDLTVGDERSSYPAPTDVLMMARKLMVKTKGTYERVINPTDGTGTLVNKSENEVESTKIHRAFLVGIPVFEGGQRYRVECRIRFSIVEGRPSFAYVMHRRREIERDAFSELRVKVGKETGYPVRPPATCTCGQPASRWMRCRICRCVVGRCGSHGEDMSRERELHEQGCQG